MGQESSTPIAENTPPDTLEARTVEAVARFIREGRAQKIVVMVELITSSCLLWGLMVHLDWRRH